MPNNIKFYNDGKGNLRQVATDKLERFKSVFPDATEANEEQLRTAESEKAAVNEQKRLASSDVNVSVPTVEKADISGSGIGNPFSRKGMDGAIGIASQHHRSNPDVQFRAKYGAFKDNPELHRDQDAPEMVERREKQPWYAKIGAGGTAMGAYNTPIDTQEKYGTTGHEKPTTTRQAQDWVNTRASKDSKQQEIDKLSDFLTNTETGRGFIDYDNNVTKYFEELKPKLDTQILELEEQLKRDTAARSKIMQRGVEGTRYGVKQSWLSDEEKEKIKQAKQKDSQEADSIATADDLNEAARTIKEIKMMRDAVNDRDKGAFTQFFNEFGRRLPQAAFDVATLGMKDITDQLENKDTGYLSGKATSLFNTYADTRANLFQHETSMAQDIANGGLHTLGFMAQMAATGGIATGVAKGVAKGAAKAFLKEGTRKFVQESTKKGVGKVVRIAGKNISEAFVQTVIMPSTFAGALEKNAEEPGSFLSAYANNFIAAFGEVGLERAGDFMPGFKFKTKFMQDVTKYTHMNSFLPEILEEDLQTAWHALFKTGEGEWADLVDPRNRLVTAGTIGLMQAPAVAIESGGYAAGLHRVAKQKRSIKQGYDRNITNMNSVFGDELQEVLTTVDGVLSEIDDSTEAMTRLMLTVQSMGDQLTETQQDAIASYGLSFIAMKGLEQAKTDQKTKAREEATANLNDNYVNENTGSVVLGKVAGMEDAVPIKGNVVFTDEGKIDTNKSGELYYTDSEGKTKVVDAHFIDLVDNTPADQLSEELGAIAETDVEIEYANDEVRPYEVGEEITYSPDGKMTGAGTITGVTQDGKYIVQSPGAQPFTIEPRMIVPEENMKGVTNGVMVEYTNDKGEVVVGEVQDSSLRANGVMIVDNQEVPTKNIIGVEGTMQAQGQAVSQDDTKEDAIVSTDTEPTEITAEQQAEQEKETFMQSLPVNNKGEIDQKQMTTAQTMQYFEYSYGAEETLKAAEQQVKNKETALKSAQTRLNSDPFNITKREKVSEIQAEVEEYKAYIFDKKKAKAQEIADTSTSSIAEEQAKQEKERAEAEAQRQAEQADIEALKGIPDVTVDKAKDARARGYRSVNGVRVDRRKTIPIQHYKDVVRKFSTNEKDHVKAQRTIVEADDLVPSHKGGQKNPEFFNDEGQPKQRTDEASKAARESIATNPNPKEITGGVSAYTGAPLFTDNGEIIQGNGRTDGLQEMWANHPDAAAIYKQHLIETAADYGMTPEQVMAMKKPIAGDRVSVSDAEAIRLGQLSAQDTESGGTQRIPAKQTAVSLGADVGRFAQILFESTNEDAAISVVIDRNGKKALDYLRQKKVINPTQYQSALDRDGNINPEAKKDLQDIASQMLFENANSNIEQMFDALPDRAQKAILQTIHRDANSPKAERIVKEIQDAIEAYSILQQSAEFNAASDYKGASISAKAARGATVMFNSESNLPLEKYSTFAMELAILFKSDSQKALRQRFNNMYDNIQGVGGDAFNAAEKLSAVQAIKKHFNNIDYVSNGQVKRNDVAGNSVTSNEGKQTGTGKTASGERAADGKQPTDSGTRTTGDNKGQVKQTTPINIVEVAKQTVAKEIKTAVEVLSKKLNTPIVVYNSAKEVPQGKHRDKQITTKGWFDPNTGQVFINLFNAANLQDARETVLHEVVGHKGLRDMLGKEKHRELLEGMFDLIPKNIQDAYLSKYGDKYGAMDEYIAYLAQNENNLTPEELGTWESIKKAIIDFIEKHLDIKLTEQNVDDVIRGLLVQSKERLENLNKAREQATAQVNTNPTQGQKEAGNYKMGHVKIAGLDITIENPKGSQRSGTDAKGKQWSITMQNDYGYIKQTEGKDGDHIDIFIGENLASDKIFVVDQVDSKGKFDEHKVMMGFDTAEQAKDAYLSNYEKGWTGLKDITETTVEDFKKWTDIKSKKQKAFAEYKQNDKAAPKQLHEMTQQEYRQKHISDLESWGTEKDAVHSSTSNQWYAEKPNKFGLTKTSKSKKNLIENIIPFEKKRVIESINNGSIDWMHEAIVEKALSEGKAIPESVLKEYPELSKKKDTPINLVELSNQVAAKEKAKQEAKKKDKTTKKEQPAEKIEDFGEVLEGAKKHTYQRIEATETDMQSQPLSKTFPKPNYSKLVEDGVLTKKGAMVLKHAYEALPSKPRKKYRVAAWVKEVEKVVATYNSLIENKEVGDSLHDNLMKLGSFDSDYSTFVEIQEAFGFPDKDVNMGAYRVIPPNRVSRSTGIDMQWLIVKGNSIVGKAESVEGIARVFNQMVDKNKKKGVVLSIYRDTINNKYFIGRKTGGGIARLVDGMTREEAIRMSKEEMPKLQEMWEARKVKPEERRVSNRKRVGTDYRKGKDVTEAQFGETFGFRGVQFGNWVNNAERQESLNDAYDAFMDLSNAIGVSPKALSLAGELGMAFGARGSGNAMAHYEPGKVVINLTKTKGAGSLAHEWWHAMDSYFSRMRGEKQGFLTESPRQKYKTDGGKRVLDTSIRTEMHEAFLEVMIAINNSDLPKRSKELDKARSNAYWATQIEMSARAFEGYIIDKLGKTGEQNDYLANFKEISEWVSSSAFDMKNYPYPTVNENAAINEAFESLFDIMQEKEEDGKQILYRDNQDFRDAHTSPTMNHATLEEATDESGDVSLSEVITGKQELVPDDFFDTRKGRLKNGSVGYMGAIRYGFNTKSGTETFDAIKALQEKVKKGISPTKIKARAYRAVPNKVEVNELIDRDWVTLSKDYAEKHGLARFGEGEYKIIEQDVPVNKLWWDGNDPNEWGYDVEDNIRYREQTESPQFKEWFGESKVVDAVGKPKVMYHQTTETAKDKIYNEGGFKRGNERASKHDFETPYGHFFKSSKNNIGVNGNTQIETFIKMENPFYAKNRDDLTWIIETESPAYKKLTDEIKAIDKKHQVISDAQEKAMSDKYREYKESGLENKAGKDAYIAEVEKWGELNKEWSNEYEAKAIEAKDALSEWFESQDYDGVILRNDQGSFGRTTDTYIVFKPNQIKSATENDGSFSKESEDIRYRVAESQAELKVFVENSEVKKTVYHGTDASFSEFEASQVGGKDFPEAIYFSSNKKVSSTYGGNILKAKIRLENPYYFDAAGRTFNDAYDALRSAFDTAINSNRDGVVITNVYDDWAQNERKGKGTTYAVFSPDQVLIEPEADIRYRESGRPQFTYPIEKVKLAVDNHISLKDIDSQKDIPNIKEKVLIEDVKDYGLYDKYEIVPVSNPLINVNNLNRSIYGLGIELYALDDLHSRALLDFDGDTGQLNAEKVEQFSKEFEGAIEPYETALLKAKHFATEAAQAEIMDIIKDIDHAKDYYARLAKDHNVLRTEEAPRYRGASEDEIFNDISKRIKKTDLKEYLNEQSLENDEIHDVLSGKDNYWLEQYLSDNFQIDITDDGYMQFEELTSEVKKIIGKNKVKLYHHTSDAILSNIVKNGLLSAKTDVNRQGKKPLGVYVTTQYSGNDVTGYKNNAASKLGGNPITIEVETTIDQLRPDTDDADIRAGAHQHVLSSVKPEQIINLSELTGKEQPLYRSVDDLADAVGSTMSKELREEYDKKYKKFTTRFREAWEDQFIAVKDFLDLLRKNGLEIEEYNDFYKQATFTPGRNDFQLEHYKDNYQHKITMAVNALEKKGFTYREIENYVFAKHGIERNEFMRRAAAENFAEAKREPVKQKAVSDQKSADKQFENDNITQEQYNKLTNKIKNAEAKQLTEIETAKEQKYQEMQSTDFAGLTALAQEVNPEGVDAGMLLDDMAQWHVEEFESNAGESLVDELWESIKKATDYSLDNHYKSGGLSRDAYTELKGRYENFVPLRGHDAEVAEDKWNYSHGNMGTFYTGAIIKADGRKTRAESPFAYIGQMAHSSIMRSTRNTLNQTLLRLAHKDKSGLMNVKRTWYVNKGTIENPLWEMETAEFNDNPEAYIQNQVDFEERMKQLSETGMARQSGKGLDIGGLFIKPKQAEQHEVQVDQNGVHYTIYINANPAVARAINGDNTWSISKGMGIFGTITRNMAANFTTRNPLFIARNASRDYIFANTMLAVKENAKYTGQFNKNIPSAFAALTRQQRGKMNLNEQTDMYLYEFMMNGGRTGFTQMLELNKMAKQLEREAKKGDSKNIVDHTRTVLSAIDVVNDVVENATRFSVYMTSRKEGRSVIQSVHDAKNVTVNFNQKGAGISQGNSLEKVLFGAAGVVRPLYLFTNAAVQSLSNFSKAAGNHPGKISIAIASYMMYGFMAPMIAGMIGGDEGEEDFMKQSEWDRQNNWSIGLPNGFIKIPLPHELRVFHRLGDNVYQAVKGNKDILEVLLDMTFALSDLLPMNPLGSADASRAELSPDFARPFAQHETNTNFMGTRIFNEWANPEAPGYTKVTTNKKGEPYAPQFMIDFFKFADNATGGDGVKKGGVSPNPDVVNHYLRGYFGGLYTLTEQSIGMLQKGIEWGKTGELNMKVRDTPLRTFYTNKNDLNISSGSTGQEYYKIFKEAKEVRRREKGYNKKVKDGEMSLPEYSKKLKELDWWSMNRIWEAMKNVKALEAQLPDLIGEAQKSKEKEIFEQKKRIVEMRSK